MTTSDEGRPVRLAVLGAGSRGNAYGRWVLANSHRARVVAVAEPDPVRRARFAAYHDCAAFADWPQLLWSGIPMDAVVIATQDSMHVQPAVRAASLGLHMLLEKPTAGVAQLPPRHLRGRTSPPYRHGCHGLTPAASRTVYRSASQYE